MWRPLLDNHGMLHSHVTHVESESISRQRRDDGDAPLQHGPTWIWPRVQTWTCSQLCVSEKWPVDDSSSCVQRRWS
ncbi:unnamed protein product [Knipowitschia caucasica]|uniref:Uncharacterized protein n=1 Tax=Knipowitschia caucasica TaxID=637954 RepID=A0AAV2JFC5_KNICA